MIRDVAEVLDLTGLHVAGVQGVEVAAVGAGVDHRAFLAGRGAHEGLGRLEDDRGGGFGGGDARGARGLHELEVGAARRPATTIAAAAATPARTAAAPVAWSASSSLYVASAMTLDRGRRMMLFGRVERPREPGETRDARPRVARRWRRARRAHRRRWRSS